MSAGPYGTTNSGPGIRREPEAAADEVFDLIIVGAGMQGIMIALEAVRRRLRPLLLERSDFGGAMTRGALRLLQDSAPRLRSLLSPPGSVEERFWWRRHFPAQVKPLPVVMPLQDGERPQAMHLLDLLERRLCRLRWGEPDPAFAQPRSLSRHEVLDVCPSLARPDLTGGITWTGLAVPSPARLCLEALRWACMTGATALNYIEVTDIVALDGAAAGVDVRDRIGSRRLRLRAPVVVSAAGASTFDLLGRSSVPEPPQLAVWSALVGRPLSPGTAISWRIAPLAGAVSYLLPTAGGALIGPLVSADHPGGSPDWRVVRMVLDELAVLMPGCKLAETEILRLFPCRMPRPGALGAGDEAMIVDAARGHGPRGLFVVFGGRLAETRRTADRLLRLAFPRHRPEPYQTFTSPRLSFGLDQTAVHEWLRGRGLEQLRTLALEESVVHLDDLILRRTPLGDRPSDAFRIAEEVCGLLRYDDDRRREEMVRLRRALAPPLRRPPAWLRPPRRAASPQPA